VSDEAGARVIAALDAMGAAYEDPELADTAVFCERYGIPLDHSGNCIIVASRSEPKQFCAGLVLSTNRLDVNGTVRRLMGVRKVSFASAEDTTA
jgi:prolyl-tRNA editing enzyme YbaK/EbsC (Cys-tRNA(Pro) deacylase)